MKSQITNDEIINRLDQNISKIEEKLGKAHLVANRHNGILLSRTYAYGIPLTWQCSNPDHKPFKASISQANTHWCRKCHIPKRKRYQSPAHLSALASLMQMDTADMTVKELYSQFEGFNRIGVFRSFLDRYDIPYRLIHKPTIDEPDFDDAPVTITPEQLSYLYLLLNSEAKVKRFTE